MGTVVCLRAYLDHTSREKVYQGHFKVYADIKQKTNLLDVCCLRKLINVKVWYGVVGCLIPVTTLK